MTTADAAAPDPRDPFADAVVLRALRALLHVESRSAAAAVLQTAVRELGGQLAPPGSAGGLPIDVSLGQGRPAVIVPDDDVAARRLTSLLPALVEDALVAAARCDRYQRQARRARTDALTGLAGRGEIDDRLAAAALGDVVCLLDLDDFKGLNDTRGHAAGDEALRRFASLLASSVRDHDAVGRYGGDEFLVVFVGIPVPVALERMRDLVRRWDEELSAGVSVGLAAVDLRGARAATAAADRALYRAKADGGRAVLEAVEGDWTAGS
jgi:diguanylate cyclase (GGDEF)-like protein